MGYSHTTNYALQNAPVNDVIWFYLKLGVQHIIPFGLDHILFIVALCLLNQKLKVIFLQATAFTVAHSITLALSMKGVAQLPSQIVEPLIAVSILFVAIENLIIQELKVWRILIVFLFGLIHGLGFASVLNEIGLPPDKFATSIVCFNVGVEIGQGLIILLIYLLLLRPFGKSDKYRKHIVFPVSVIIGAVACYWTIERLV